MLFLADCAHGALCGARSAADANFGIYLEFIRTLTDCADGAGSLTATARNALRTDFVSHNTYLLVKILCTDIIMPSISNVNKNQSKIDLISSSATVSSTSSAMVFFAFKIGRAHV